MNHHWLTKRWFEAVRQLTVPVLVVALTAMPASADVSNGDFEGGGADWSDTTPPGFATSFPATGGNPGGYALIETLLPNTGGSACISQTFDCGVEGGGTECTIGFDFQLVPLDALPGSARIVVTISGTSNVVTDTPTTDWEFVSYVVPCGEHTIDICLEVDPENNLWEASIDNVRAACTGPVSTEAPSWSTVKALYR